MLLPEAFLLKNMYIRIVIYNLNRSAMSEDEKKEDAEKKSIKIPFWLKIIIYIVCVVVAIIIICALCFFLWWGTTRFMMWFLNTPAWPDLSFPANEIGDSFGTVNAVLSSLAFIGVVVAIFLQQKQIDIQKKEIDEQKRLVQIQRFEDKFFKLLDLHNNIAERITLNYRSDESSPYKTIIGRDAFSESLNSDYISVHGNSCQGICGAITQSSTFELSDYIPLHTYDSYFRNLFVIFDLIDSISDKILTSDAKYEYASILHSQLTGSERVFLFFRALYMYNTKMPNKPKLFIEKYHFLAGVNTDKYSSPPFDRFYNEYNPSAFYNNLSM